MLKITQGDTVTFNLTAKDGPGALFDLTGASFQTQIRGPGGTIRTFPNSQHVANPDQTSHKGEFTLALSAADTASLAVGEDHEMVTRVTQGSSIIYFHGFILTVLAAAPAPVYP